MSEFLGMLILLILSGVFSGSETALVSLSMGRAEALLQAGRSGARALYALKHAPSRMLITILIGNNVVNIGASALATVVATERLGHLGPGIAVGVLTILILIFGEITPKSLATRHAERISLLIAPPMYALQRAILPLVWVFEKLTDWVHRQTGIKGDPTVTEAELIRMLGHGEMEGTIETVERVMIERVFAFNELTVEDVMVPRQHMVVLDGARGIWEVLPAVVEAHLSRFPVYRGHQDDIRGVVLLRDVLESVARERLDIPVSDIAHKPLFVPVSEPIDNLFDTLREQKKHLAIVVDELGAVQGLVTMEDLLEELVGEIYDESDQPSQPLQPLDENRVMVDGEAELRLVEAFFQMELPGKPTDTVSLWILGHTERIPKTRERFSLDGLDVTIAKATNRRIQQVLLSRGSPKAQSAGPEV